MTRPLAVLALTAMVAGVAAPFDFAQGKQQQPVFRGGTRTVPVFVTVNDGAGGFALNLTQDDFEVKDNGKVQTITQFTTATQALSTLLLLDGSSSMWSVFDNLMDGANAFIMRMLPEDRTAIASFADRFQMRQPFTSNRDVLLAHLRDQFNVRVGLETHLWDALDESMHAFTKEPNRRVIVLLSDGKNWVAPAQSQLPQPGQPTRPGQPTPLGGRAKPGTAPPVPSSPSPVPMPTPNYNTSGARGAAIITNAIGRDIMVYTIAMWTMTDEKLPDRPGEAMARISDQTGGGLYQLRLSDDINATFTQIMAELHQQYLLGFTPAVLDGKEHRLEVRVKKSGMRVRARRSYIASVDGEVREPR
jgi:Ca-activated chloride channel family protein